MTGSVIVIFIAIVFVWAIVGPSVGPVQVAPPPKNYEEGEGGPPTKKKSTGPPNVVNHRPKREKKIPEEDRTLTTDTFTRMMGKEKNNVRFE